jgi:hypothetical protein
MSLSKQTASQQIPIIVRLDEMLYFCSTEHAKEHEAYSGWVGSVTHLQSPGTCATCGQRLAWMRYNIVTHSVELVPPNSDDWAELF